ncbi:GNAT family N-acetyltransferase [Sinirhodobacter sp. WL0062]|uniref:GNAT family N-acetyltransferase n=1 Tax=Rhodobacter flavimaris TaxID=2907145 RepID=A0ABS8Z092_9RHOB|nr:GNAT family N-acetyltransferase [Sinirhodobacter sp. WL0062]MCE5975218.1 GNAT family N-acetyltransferase [Sinirhodobacter sp. WL0062]
MDITSISAGRETEIVALFEATFTASEGADEGALIGDFVRDLLASTPEADLRVFCVQEGGALIGAGIFSRLHFPEDPRSVFILSPMAVATDRQGQGVGQALLRAALAALKSEGVDVAVTYGDPAYYGRVGFAPITDAQARAPLPLSFPHGWLGQSLSQDPMPQLAGPSHCIPALNRPALW